MLAKAKLTDFMGFSPSIFSANFCISERVKNILSHFNIQPNILFQTHLYRNGAILTDTYYFLYVPFLEYESINFNKSQLYKTEVSYLGRIKTKTIYYDLTSYDDWVKLFISTLGFSKLSLKPEFKQYDLIHLRTGQWYISGDLRDAFESENITGLDIIYKTDITFDNR